MSGSVALAVGAGAIFGALVLLLLVLRPAPKSERVSKERLLVDSLPLPRGGNAAPAAKASRKAATTRITEVADGALARSGRKDRLASALDIADLSLRPAEFLVLVAGITIGVALVLGLLAGPIGVILALSLAPLVARVHVQVRVDKRRKAFENQLPDVLQLLVSSLRAGYSLPQALNAVAEQCEEPAKKEFQRVLLEARIGRDPSEALAATAERMQSKDFDWVVTATQINREVGGELAHVLENVANTVRARHKMKRQINTLTAEGRMSAYVLTALPFILVVILSVTNPGYFEPMMSGLGVALGVGAVLLMSTGWIWMRRVIKAQM